MSDNESSNSTSLGKYCESVDGCSRQKGRWGAFLAHLDRLAGKGKALTYFGVAVVIESLWMMIAEDQAGNGQINLLGMLYGILKDGAQNTLIFGFIFICFGIFLTKLTDFFEEFWLEEINPLANKGIDAVREEIGGATQEFIRQQTEARAQKAITQVIAESTRDAARENLKAMHVRAYGPHCANDNQSLYGYTSKLMHNFLDPETPHRSRYRKTVNISEIDGQKISWSEICTYNLHVIGMDKDYFNPQLVDSEKGVEFYATYGTTCLLNGAKAEDAINDINIKITLDEGSENAKVFDLSVFLKDNPHFVKTLGSSSQSDVDDEFKEGFMPSIDIDEETIEVRVRMSCLLKRPFTKVKVEELSVLPKEDNCLLITHQGPTCGADITVTLPDKWKIGMHREAIPKDWSVHNERANILVAENDSWVLPGLVFYCDWLAKEKLLKNRHP